jgi:hypothetical protein
MKVIISILAFVASWTVITFTTAFAISLVFNLDYTSVVYFPVFVATSLLLFTTAAVMVADEVYNSF